MVRARTFEWIFVQLSGTGPAFGQSGYWQKLASERNHPAIARYLAEADRLAHLIDAHLATHIWLPGKDYTIADIEHFSWLWRRDFAGVTFENRPAAQRGIAATTALVETQAA